MSGQCYLPEVMSRLTADDLNWQWELALLCKGQATRIFPRNVTPMWKPVLWYVKGKYQGDCVVDVITSDQNDKRFHQWGQSESGMAALVERFSLPGQTILDPFLGGGTTGVVALKLDAASLASIAMPTPLRSLARGLPDERNEGGTT